MEILLVVVGFLCGAIPFGYLTGRMKGVDIRKVGSGNIGATNVSRVLGKRWGWSVFAMDFLKGYLPTLAAGHFLAGRDGWIVGVGLATVLGHNFTPFLKFKGGKGVATSAGVLLAMMPRALGVSAFAWAVVFFAGRYISLASIVAAMVLPVAAWFFYAGRMWLIGTAAVMCVLAVVRHRSNIQRLLQGKEPKIGKKNDETTKTS